MGAPTNRTPTYRNCHTHAHTHLYIYIYMYAHTYIHIQVSQYCFWSVSQTTNEAMMAQGQPISAPEDQRHRVPKEHINIRISHSGSAAQKKGDSRNHGLWNGCVYVVFWGPEALCSNRAHKDKDPIKHGFRNRP